MVSSVSCLTQAHSFDLQLNGIFFGKTTSHAWGVGRCHGNGPIFLDLLFCEVSKVQIHFDLYAMQAWKVFCQSSQLQSLVVRLLRVYMPLLPPLLLLPDGDERWWRPASSVRRAEL